MYVLSLPRAGLPDCKAYHPKEMYRQSHLILNLNLLFNDLGLTCFRRISSTWSFLTFVYLELPFSADTISRRGVWLQTPTHPTGLNFNIKIINLLISISFAKTSLLPPATQHDPRPILTSASKSSLSVNFSVLFPLHAY